MTQEDFDSLIDMGFEKARAELAVKKHSGLEQALNWLEKNQDRSIEELQAAAQENENKDEATKLTALEGGQQAASLVCNECGKKFRTHDSATFHAAKSGHTDFAESTDEIAPLTEEEKKARLEEMREKLKAKRAAQSVADVEDAKRNEKIRMKATQESQDIKEELKRKEQIKEAAKKRMEKQADMEARKAIKAKIEADKAERKRKAEEAKATREGRTPPNHASSALPVAPAPAPKGPVTHTEARLRLQTAAGNVQKTYPAETTLNEVARQLEAETGTMVASFTTTFPKKVFWKGVDFGQTLKEAGLVPSAVLIIK